MKLFLEKGTKGYIEKRRVRQLIYTLLAMIMVAVFFFTGYIRYKSTKTIFTVFAVLAVLPAAKYLSIYFITARYHSCDFDTYDRVNDAVRNINGVLICDLILTNEEKNSNIDLAVIKGNRILGYIKDKKTDKKYAADYIKTIVSKSYKISSVTIFSDEKKYLSAVNNLATTETSKYDENIAELMLSYSI